VAAGHGRGPRAAGVHRPRKPGRKPGSTLPISGHRRDGRGTTKHDHFVSSPAATANLSLLVTDFSARRSAPIPLGSTPASSARGGPTERGGGDRCSSGAARTPPPSRSSDHGDPHGGPATYSEPGAARHPVTSPRSGTTRGFATASRHAGIGSWTGHRGDGGPLTPESTSYAATKCLPPLRHPALLLGAGREVGPSRPVSSRGSAVAFGLAGGVESRDAGRGTQPTGANP